MEDTIQMFSEVQVSPWCPHFLPGCLGEQRLLQSCREPAADILSGHPQLLSPDLSEILCRRPHLSLINLVLEPPGVAAKVQDYI